MSSTFRAALVFVLATIFLNTSLLAQSQADSAVAPCTKLPPPIGWVADTVYASLRSVGRDTLPAWYSQTLLESLIEHYQVPTPLDIPVVGGPIHIPARTSARLRGIGLTALGSAAPGSDRKQPDHHEPHSNDVERIPSMQPEPVSVSIKAEVSFSIQRDGTLRDAQIFTSSLSTTFDESLRRIVSALDSTHALPPLPETIRRSSVPLVLTALDRRDSTQLQEPLFHATLPVWMADHSAFPRRNNPVPLYPLVAERAHVGDQVVYSFVVDASGVPRMETLRLLRGKYQDFERAVLDVLPKWRFFPATISGCAVAQAAAMPFTFRSQRN